jgi:hypothetical protein
MKSITHSFSYEATNEATVFSPPGKRAHQHVFASIKGLESGNGEEDDRPKINKPKSDDDIPTVIEPKNP